MAQPLHHSFVLRPPSACPNHSNKKHKPLPKTKQASADFIAPVATRSCSPIPQPQVIPSLTFCQDKTLTSPPLWSRRRCLPRPTSLFRRFSYEDSRLRQEFEPPLSPTYWKNRCQHFQRACQNSRKRIRDLEEDQRQLRRRIHKLEERLTKNESIPESPSPQKGSSVPAVIVTDSKQKECFYLADCEGMSDSEYGQHFYNFDDFDEDSDEE